MSLLLLKSSMTNNFSLKYNNVLFLNFLRLRKFDSGVLVVQSVSHSEEEVINKTYTQVNEAGSLSAEEFSQLCNMALTISRER